jgi:uncharacterized protein involved in exopolysaccharide biosynthesis
MLETPTRLRAVHALVPEQADDELAFSIVLNVLRRQAVFISLVFLSALTLATAYLVVSSNRFTATAQLLTDTNRSDSPAAQYGLVDTAVVDSQVETIKSEKIAIAVINKLNLTEDPEFYGGGLVGQLLGYVGLAGDDVSSSEPANLRKTVAKFKRGLTVLRIGRSYVANIMFTSKDPHKAAVIANEVANSYIEDQLDAKALMAERASSWMQKRIVDLREQATAASRALDQFNAAHLRGNESAELDSDQQSQSEELTRTAKSLRRAYETLENLSRYSQSIDERTLPTTDARVVTQASPPLVASSPNVLWTLMIALVAGGGLGLIGAFVREHTSSGLARGQLAPVRSSFEDETAAE